MAGVAMLLRNVALMAKLSLDLIAPGTMVQPGCHVVASREGH